MCVQMCHDYLIYFAATARDICTQACHAACDAQPVPLHTFNPRHSRRLAPACRGRSQESPSRQATAKRARLHCERLAGTVLCVLCGLPLIVAGRGGAGTTARTRLRGWAPGLAGCRTWQHGSAEPVASPPTPRPSNTAAPVCCCASAGLAPLRFGLAAHVYF